jgi:outer membrane PBP1 activator LpoA protein
VLPTLVANAPFRIEYPRQIALLLPLNSRYQGEAEAFRSGALFMHESDNHPDQPTIKLYDTGLVHQEIRAIYEKAIAEGADFIIGPLGRQAIDQLVSDKRFPVPTLLIGNPTNPASASPNVYQLGMAPEQDGVQLARRAYATGHRRALIIFAASDWGRRVSTATSNDWARLGGKIVAQTAVPVTSDHFTHAIRRLFHLDHSAARAAALKKVLTHRLPFKAIPRRRQDVDVIFLFCSRSQAQVINPQIDFLYGHDLPVFSTSHLYHGTQDRLTDLDLDGIILGDMPWILGSNGPRAFRAGGTNNPNTYRGTPLDRLFALGMDAYALSSRITALRTIPEARYAGFSGQLSSDGSGVIRRKLMWAQFQNAELIAMPQLNASQNEGDSYLNRGDDS